DVADHVVELRPVTGVTPGGVLSRVGVMDHDVEPTEVLNGPSDEFGTALLVGEIELDEVRRTTCFGDLLDHRFALSGVTTAHHHFGAVAGEAGSDRFSDSLGG